MKVPKFNKGDIVWFEWEDHYHNYTAGWTNDEGRDAAGGFAPMYCETVGFVVHDDGKHVALAISHDQAGSTNGGYSVKIKSTIRQYKILKKAKAN